MNKFLSGFFAVIVTAITFAGMAATSNAQFPNRTNRTNRASNQQISSVLSQLQGDTNTFRSTFELALNRNRNVNATVRTDGTNYLNDFEDATSQFQTRFDGRNASSADIQIVLDRASVINNFLRQNNFNARVRSDWTRVTNDLRTLSGYYNVRFDIDSNVGINNGGIGIGNNGNIGIGNNGNIGNNRFGNRLTGTYRLDSSRSTDLNAEINRQTSGLSVDQQDRIRRQASRRLEAPELLAIDRNGNQVSIASSKSPQITVNANGQSTSEVMPNGRSMSINSSITGEQLVINYSGDRSNDFYVAFNPVDNGNGLRVTRRIYLEGANRQITVDSFYTKTSGTADFSAVNNGSYNGNNNGNFPNNGNNGNFPNNGNNNGSQSDTFIVPNGTSLVAVLQSDLDTKTANTGDRFTMTVRSPQEYEGATIEGTVGNVQRSGRVSGRAQLDLNFDTIRLRNNQTYRFAGFLQSVRNQNGDNVAVSNEGTVRDGSQTTRTATRAGIGAAVGALIGAIAGGGTGAAIGAGVGAGAGAGSVVLQGKDDLRLQQGSEITISTSSPSNVR
ncbi:MAG: hypothetical protein H7Z37_11390 [Pyrinomonadaceae bacterium]|nr:hypothetical protein [Pyrinomonadaceae bacterium]